MFRNSGGFVVQDMQNCLQIIQTLAIYAMIRPVGIDSTDMQLDKIKKTIFQSKEEK